MTAVVHPPNCRCTTHILWGAGVVQQPVVLAAHSHFAVAVVVCTKRECEGWAGLVSRTPLICRQAGPTKHCSHCHTVPSLMQLASA